MLQTCRYLPRQLGADSWIGVREADRMERTEGHWWVVSLLTKATRRGWMP